MDPRIDPGLACSSRQFRCQLRPHKVDLNFVSTLLPRYILPLSFDCGTSSNLHYRLRLQRLLLSLQLHQSLVRPLYTDRSVSRTNTDMGSRPRALGGPGTKWVDRNFLAVKNATQANSKVITLHMKTFANIR